MKTSTLAVPFALVVVACGGSTPPPEPPPTGSVTSTTTATETTTTTPASSATPASTTTSAAPSGGQCKSGEPPANATDLDSCKAGCQALDDSVPPGTRCISARASCVSQCNTKYKK